MNKKKSDLEAIVDLLHEWCLEYREPYVMAFALTNKEGHVSGSADIETERPEHDAVSVFRKYETPGAATPRESK